MERARSRRRTWRTLGGQPRHAGPEEPTSTATVTATAPTLPPTALESIAHMAAGLASAPTGLGFVYSTLEGLCDAGGWDDAVLVLDEELFGRQVFRARRRPPWESPVLRRKGPRLGSGLHPAYGSGGALDPEVCAAAVDLCTVALRTDLLRHDAAHDGLTTLLNRRSFDEALDRAASRAERYAWPCTLVMIDVDDFKSVNDRLGHGAGDQLLRAVGGELRRALRAGDVAGRLGGDEFGLLLDGVDASAAPPLLTRLQMSVRAVVDGLHPTFSAGTASAPHDAVTADGLFRLADHHLYEAKAQRGGGA